MTTQSKNEGNLSIARALGEEHDAILKMLNILNKVSYLLDSGKRVEVADLERINNFLSSFVDKCHHGKEEEALFPAMRKGGADQRFIGDLLREHTEGRTRVRRMGEAIKMGAKNDYSAVSKEYSELLVKHIEKENNIAFPLADRMLSDEQKERILEQFEEIEEKRIGLDEHHRLLREIDDLGEKYA